MMRDERSDDKPPYSRLFVVCNKQHREEDLRPLFEAYGEIEELHLPRDRNTGEHKGIAYIKYRKTSSAAAAIESLHMKHIQNSNKPIKVMVSSNKTEEKNDNENKYKRLFLRVAKETTESDIRDHFNKFGRVVYVRLQKDRDTNECRGFAYVNYDTFLEAATAYEECDKKYKPVFAIPKDDLKRTRYNTNADRFPSSDSVYMREFRNDIDNNFRQDMHKKDSILPLIKSTPGGFDIINVSCSPCVSQKPLEKLFNVIPGMIQFKFTSDSFSGSCNAVIKYDSRVAAAHAVETLNNYEFPSGETISVKPDENPLSKVASNLSNIVNSFKNSLDPNTDLLQLADAIAQASSLIKAATSGTDTKVESSNDDFCSVILPPVKPLANIDSKVAQRCFIVFKPHSLPVGILRDIFCRFGNLIDVSALPNKTFGFAKYASVGSAQEAMKTLNGASVHGVKLKVLEAEEKPVRDDKMHVDDDDKQLDDERKRPKLDRALTIA